MKLYSTVKGRGEARQIIEKSKFICYVSPADTREDAEAFFDEIRKKHRDATHNVPCMVIGEKMQLQWASDDGEPQGTSGAPLVQLLVNEGITNTAIVVTRYFGGIKLGTGGLVRAYTSSAKLGLAAAGVCNVEEKIKLDYVIDYTHLSKIQKAASDKLLELKDIVYLDKIRISVVVDMDERDEKCKLIDNLTSGKAEQVGEEAVKIRC